jgi:hypothetical protein
MPESGQALLNGLKQVAVAGTRVKLPSVSELVGGENYAAKTVTIQALSTNTGKIAVGGAKVVAAVGTKAAPKTEGVLLNAGDTISLDIIDTADIWLDATVNEDGVSFVVLCA